MHFGTYAIIFGTFVILTESDWNIIYSFWNIYYFGLLFIPVKYSQIV